MRKRDKSKISIENRIAKQKSMIKFVLISHFIVCVLVIVGSILIWALTPEWELAVKFLIALPIILPLSIYIEIQICKEKIKALEKELDARQLDVADE